MQAAPTADGLRVVSLGARGRGGVGCEQWTRGGSPFRIDRENRGNSKFSYFFARPWAPTPSACAVPLWRCAATANRPAVCMSTDRWRQLQLQTHAAARRLATACDTPAAAAHPPKIRKPRTKHKALAQARGNAAAQRAAPDVPAEFKVKCLRWDWSLITRLLRSLRFISSFYFATIFLNFGWPLGPGMLTKCHMPSYHKRPSTSVLPHDHGVQAVLIHHGAVDESTITGEQYR